MRIYVKYMVGLQCSEKIEKELARFGVVMGEIDHGVLEFQEELDASQLLQLKEGLLELGYEVLDSDDSDLLDEILEMIKKLIYKKPEMDLSDYPEYLKDRLGFDDSESGNLFSLVHGVNVIQYATIQQVERIKEMILYENKELGEIVEILHFRNEAQLTRVFHNITGLRPADYIQIRNKRQEIRKENGFG